MPAGRLGSAIMHSFPKTHDLKPELRRPCHVPRSRNEPDRVMTRATRHSMTLPTHLQIYRKAAEFAKLRKGE